MSQFIPVYAYPDKMPVDISFVFEDEKPAGKHGFTQVKGENLYFEDGKLAKFWGVMFNGAACFPPHERAEAVAQRLSQAGINIVRLHQMDDEWVAPNLYRLTAGKRVTTTRVLCPESMERLDYLLKCLKEKGIYVTVDMTTYRRFKPGDGVKYAHLLHDGTRLYAMYDPTMIELQKEFCRNFWNHVNPYTGLAYKDDPMFAMCCIINENDTYIDHSTRRWYNLIPYYDDMLRDMFDKWLKEKGIEYDAYGCELFTKDQPMQQFRMELMRNYLDDMYAYIRSLGVKVPLSGSNYHTNCGIVKASENMDFTDAHSYFYDWKWGENEKLCAHRSVTGFPTTPLAGPCAMRIHGKPFFMTEWDMPFPNSYRAEGPLWFPAVACLQNWTGMTIHTYGYGHDMSKFDLLGKAASTNTIGGVPYREGIFAVWNDPAKFGQFYHGALMFRRGDVSPAKTTLGGKITEEMYGKRAHTLHDLTMEKHQVHMVLDSTDTSDLKYILDPSKKLPAYELETMAYDAESGTMKPTDASVATNPKIIVSDTGELTRNMSKQVGYIDTPMTKSAYGRIGTSAVNKRDPSWPAHELNGLTIRCKTDFACITLSSLSEDDLNNSGNILLTTVGRARNHGAQFDGEKMIDRGTGPIEVEVIHAQIELKTSKEILEVWSVDSEGFYSGKIDSVIEDGVLKFTVGEEYPCMYYLIVEP